MILILVLLLLNVNEAFIHIPKLITLKLNIINSGSFLLPKIDVFGHKILEQNRILIEKITHMDNISIELKKELLLSVIKFTEYGDSFGNFVLKNYEHLINDCLEIEYWEESKIFVPVESMHLVSKYYGSKGVNLDRLGSKKFGVRKEEKFSKQFKRKKIY